MNYFISYYSIIKISSLLLFYNHFKNYTRILFVPAHIQINNYTFL